MNQETKLLLVLLIMCMVDPKMKEINVNLNVHEVGVILAALQTLDMSDEKIIAREYGSVPALYNKLYTLWEQMDRSETGLRNDIVPSF